MRIQYIVAELPQRDDRWKREILVRVQPRDHDSSPLAPLARNMLRANYGNYLPPLGSFPCVYGPMARGLLLLTIFILTEDGILRGNVNTSTPS